MSKEKYFLLHWKLGLHLILKTRRFGVNNVWWSPFPSLWGQSLLGIWFNVIAIFPLLRSYRAVKMRLGPGIGFIPLSHYQYLYKTKK